MGDPISRRASQTKANAVLDKPPLRRRSLTHPPPSVGQQTGNARRASNGAKEGDVGPADAMAPRYQTHLDARYTSHIRSSSRISWDGSFFQPRSRSPSPSPTQSHAVRRSNQPRPRSAISLPDHAFGRPPVPADRWSYDRERMPSSPPSSYVSRPGTPSGGYGASTPSLRVIPPSDSIPWRDYESETEQPPQRTRQKYHLLTDAEMEMLSHPPSAHSPASPPSPAPRGPTPRLDREAAQPDTLNRSHASRKEDSDSGSDTITGDKPGCLGLCEISTANAIGGKFGAWFLGTAIPIASGLITGCVAAAAGCR